MASFWQKLQTRKDIFMNRVFPVRWQPDVRSIDETLDKIIADKCSVSRFGDGELDVCIGGQYGYQSANAALAKRLREILCSNLPGHMVCIINIFGDLSYLKKESIEYETGLLKKFRRKWCALLDKSKTYYNSYIVRCYNMFADKSPCAGWFEKNRRIWQDRDVLLIEGAQSRLGVGNDLFDNAKSMQRILCPPRDAFDQYDQIFALAKQQDKNRLVLLALGACANVLAYDLHQEGFWAVDIGHIDIEYEWFLRGANQKIKIEGKYVNEAPGGREVADIHDEKYESEIIARIL